MRTCIHARTDFGRRRELRIKGSITPYLNPSAVASLNRVGDDQSKGR